MFVSVVVITRLPALVLLQMCKWLNGVSSNKEPQEVLGILTTFANNLDSAIKDNEEADARVGAWLL